MTRRPRRTMKKALDGDTLELKKSINGSKFFRLQGINTPEKGQSGYLYAKRVLSSITKGKIFGLKIVAKDKYGRNVGTLFKGNINLNKRLKRIL